MKIKMRNSAGIFGLPVFCAILMSSCGGESMNSSNAANSAPNISSANVSTSNKPINSMTDTNVSNINTTANANKAGNQTMSVILNEDFMKGALKTRLEGNDAGKIFNQQQWQTDVWLNTPIGVFYENDPEFVTKAVREVTIEKLALNHKEITDDSLSRLEDNVTTATLCKKAVKEMVRATFDAKITQPTP